MRRRGGFRYILPDRRTRLQHVRPYALKSLTRATRHSREAPPEGARLNSDLNPLIDFDCPDSAVLPLDTTQNTPLNGRGRLGHLLLVHVTEWLTAELRADRAAGAIKIDIEPSPGRLEAQLRPGNKDYARNSAIGGSRPLIQARNPNCSQIPE